MGMQKSHGGRPLPRVQRFLIFAVLLLFSIFSVQFWVHEQRFSDQQHNRNQSGYSKAMHSTLTKESEGQLSSSSDSEVDYDIDNSRSIQDLRQDNPLLLDELMETVEACEDAGGKLAIEECRMRLRTNRASLHQSLSSSPPPPPSPPSSLSILHPTPASLRQSLTSSPPAPPSPSPPSSPSILNPTPRLEFATEELIKSPEKEVVKDNNTTINIQIQQQQQQQAEHSSIEFMMLKDVKAPALSDTDNTWFMSSIRKPIESGDFEELEFPSELSQGRLLCLKGDSPNDGTQNAYGFAPKERLPPGAVLMPGITLVSDSYWDYQNIWHGMSSLTPFAGNRQKYGCGVPQRLLLFHWGEVIDSTSVWMENLLQAAFGKKVEVDTVRQYYEKKAATEAEAGARAGEAIGGESSEGSSSEPVACLEHAYVNRRGFGRSSVPKLRATFGAVRCRAWKFCKIEPGSTGGSTSSFTSTSVSTSTSATGEGIQSTHPPPHVSLFLRTGARAFNNTSEIIRIVEEACDKKLGRCTLEITYTENLTFCQQVALMRRTDVLVTTHGAQMTNAMFMPKGASVMEFVPYGWLDLAGVGQYIYSWLAEWTELKHEGYWRDPEGPNCPYPPTETLECFLFYKDRQVGFNSTYTVEWMNKVLDTFKGVTPSKAPQNAACACDSEDEKLLNTGQL